MNKKKILKKLEDDEHYYGEFGQQYLSNSNVGTLLDNPLSLREQQKPNINFLLGGYFHTAILEPEKLEKYKIIDASTRNTKIYKDLSDGKMCLLKHEVENLKDLIDITLSNKVCNELIKPKKAEYEVPNIGVIEGENWKGKADIVNHSEKLIIDLKTTSNLKEFKWSAKRYNYDSQAYIYKQLFGYEFIFIVVDKITKQIGIFDCSENFYNTGHEKVKQAAEAYRLFYKNPDFNPKNYFKNETL